ncbi:MAG: SRPBCC domain-containing protein [Armatimonadetes bacterium]|nr:SRPBCC domain-containing protein [Armatimonadota bacterium]
MMNLIALASTFALSVMACATLNESSRVEPETTIETTGVVAAPIQKVWEAWTTTKGICQWMVPNGKVDFRIGGSYITSYSKESDLSGPDVIVNKILAYDPLRMITINNEKIPAGFPYQEAMSKTWTVIYFKSLDSKRTEVTVRMNGFDESSDSKKLKGFFVQGNQETLDSLVKLFEKTESAR